MSVKTYPFDVADHLNFEDDIRGFLREMAKTGDTNDFVHALSTAARAKGMSKIAKKIGVSRSSLYKSLSGETSPGFETINSVVEALGLKLEIA